MRRISRIHEGPGRVINNRDMVDGSSNTCHVMLELIKLLVNRLKLRVQRRIDSGNVPSHML